MAYYNNSLTDRFGKEGSKGQRGEDWLHTILKSYGYEVTDYGSNVEHQKRGYDFSIKKPNWLREYYLDCKNNLFVDSEYHFKIEIEDHGKLGWFFSSRADRIYHVSTYANSYLMYDLNEMRQLVVNALLKNDTSLFKRVSYNGALLLQFDINDMNKGLYPITIKKH